MTGLLWVVEAVLLGCLLAWRWIDLSQVQPAWARVLLRFGAGAAGGMGLASCVFFVVGVLAGSDTAAMLVEVALLAWAAFEVFRRLGLPHGHVAPAPASATGNARTPLLLVAAALLAVAIATAAIAAGWQSNPLGNWDAWDLWNLRARFWLPALRWRRAPGRRCWA